MNKKYVLLKNKKNYKTIEIQFEPIFFKNAEMQKIIVPERIRTTDFLTEKMPRKRRNRVSRMKIRVEKWFLEKKFFFDFRKILEFRQKWVKMKNGRFLSIFVKNGFFGEKS